MTTEERVAIRDFLSKLSQTVSWTLWAIEQIADPEEVGNLKVDLEDAKADFLDKWHVE